MRSIEFNLEILERKGDSARSRYVLCLLIETLAKINLSLLIQTDTDPDVRAPFPLLLSPAARVEYRPEPEGEEEWPDITRIYPRGWGDCEDLAAARLAEVWHSGESGAEPYIRWRVQPDGRYCFHALLKRANGTIEDPSEQLGMYRHRAEIEKRGEFIGDDGRPWDGEASATEIRRAFEKPGAR